jgi:signal transduction histidine kinase
MLAADGRIVWLRDIVTVVVENDQPVRLQGVMVDVTEHKRVEEELRKHREHLEELIAERTAELAIAKKKAEEADRLKSAFLATMSHELRTPLNSIIGFTGILLQGLVGPLNEEQQKQLGMVKSSARHLLNLINDILDLSKIEAGQMELRLESFDMAALIDKTVQNLTLLAEKKKLKLVTDIAPEVDRVLSDPRRVEQVLLNLVNNAIKFTEQGQVCVECRVRDGRLVTRVVDTGIGIKPEDIGKLFTSFRQLDSTLGRKHEGTGLGLAICQKLAGLLGGELRVESTWGVGSAFTFVLPLNR